VDEPGLEQDPQVLGEGLSHDVEALGDLPGGALAFGDEPEHFTAAGLDGYLEGIGTSKVHTCASDPLQISHPMSADAEPAERIRDELRRSPILMPDRST
jgi:hypothetical protein